MSMVVLDSFFITINTIFVDNFFATNFAEEELFVKMWSPISPQFNWAIQQSDQRRKPSPEYICQWIFTWKPTSEYITEFSQ